MELAEPKSGLAHLSTLGHKPVIHMSPCVTRSPSDTGFLHPQLTEIAGKSSEKGPWGKGREYHLYWAGSGQA